MLKQRNTVREELCHGQVGLVCSSMLFISWIEILALFTPVRRGTGTPILALIDHGPDPERIRPGGARVVFVQVYGWRSKVQIDWLVDWMIGWLVDLIDWFVCCFDSIFGCGKQGFVVASSVETFA